MSEEEKRIELLHRLEILRRNGYPVDFRHDMTTGELEKVYETQIAAIREENEESSRKTTLVVAILHAEMCKTLPPGMAARLLSGNLTSREIVDELAKHVEKN